MPSGAGDRRRATPWVGSAAMAVQSLYRRYRPRRFAELRGQDHVVRALRTAVAEGREGHAYLFSGPRGTGKTSSARILAKVLNCEAPVDGEPCCQCASCAAVESGTSYDVFELDAASNNGVDDIRNLIEKAALGNPGRHKVYILDEVHMLSKAAEAALLKTLEEPPDHVVFVLATTDPQKVSDTIRSRTQHLQFHLLPIDDLEAHVRWVAGDAGIELGDDALAEVLRQGGGSARDTLSALELVAVSGGVVEQSARLEELLDALADQDTGLALATVAHAVHVGRDPRSLADEIVRTLRDAFLSLMAPELVQVPTSSAARLAEQAQRVGAPLLVRSMEVIGSVLVEMRHAPDPRLLLEVALVKLTNTDVDPGVASLLTRIKHLEDLVAALPASAGREAPAPDPVTGRARIGSRARTADATGPVPVPPEARTGGGPLPVPPAGAGTTPPIESAGPAPEPVSPSVSEPVSEPAPSQPSTPAGDRAHGSLDKVVAAWSSEVLPALKPMARAVLAGGNVSIGDGVVVLAVPNDPHRARVESYRAEVERVLASVGGGTVRFEVVTEASNADSRRASDRTGGTPRPQAAADGQGAGSDDRSPTGDTDEHIDLDDLIDAPTVPVENTIDHLTRAFPGSELVEGDD
jgi:DNA polymerase III subunit gamma/tau